MRLRTCDDGKLEKILEVYSVLEALKPALKSIDVRTIAVSLGENWQNLITSVLITEKTVDEVRKEQENMPPLRNNSIALFLKAIPFDYTLLNNISEGEVRFSTPFGVNRVQFRMFDPIELRVSSNPKRNIESYSWILTATDSGKQGDRQQLWNVANNNEITAKRLGFPNIGNLVKHSFNIEYGTEHSKDFELTIPPLASIEKVCFINSTVEVQVKKVKDLSDLQLNLTLNRENTIIKIMHRKVQEKKPDTCNPLNLITETFEFESIIPCDLIEVELILRESALTLDKKSGLAPLSNSVEPLLKALNAFCSIEKFESMLLEPHIHTKTDITLRMLWHGCFHLLAIIPFI